MGKLAQIELAKISRSTVTGADYYLTNFYKLQTWQIKERLPNVIYTGLFQVRGWVSVLMLVSVGISGDNPCC